MHYPANGADWRDRVFPTLPQRPAPPPPDPDPDRCAQVYDLALEFFRMGEDELAQLQRERHLTNAMVAQYGPFGRFDPARADTFASTAVERFGDEIVDQVPGFYYRPNNGPLSFVPSKDTGDRLLLPIPDLQGRHHRLRIRTGIEGRKYIWVSSGERGAGSGSPVGVYLPTRPGWTWDLVAIVEGEFKAMIVAETMHIPVICVAGVNAIAGVLPVLREMGTKTAAICYDADAATNEHVAAAEHGLARKLFGGGLRVLKATWSLEVAKGIDDLLNLGMVPILEPFRLGDGEALAADVEAGPTIRTDVPLTAQLGAALREIEALAKQVAAQAEQITSYLSEIDRLKLLQSQTMAAFRSKDLGNEKLTGVALAFEIQNQKAADPNKTEFPICYDRIAEQTGLSSSAVAKHIKEKLPTLADKRTGEVVPLFVRDVRRAPTADAPFRTENVFIPTTDPSQWLDYLANAIPDSGVAKSGHGGKRVRRCPDHPDAKIVKKTSYCCSICNKVVDADEPVVMSTHDDTPDDPQDVVMSSEQDATSGEDGAEPWNEQDATSGDEALETPPPLAPSTVNVLRMSESPTRHNVQVLDAPPGSVAASWMAGARLVEPTLQELVPRRGLPGESDHATDQGSPPAPGSLAAKLDGLDRLRGRPPVPKPVVTASPSWKPERPDYDEMVFA
jgi:hypothetical protein